MSWGGGNPTAGGSLGIRWGGFLLKCHRLEGVPPHISLDEVGSSSHIIGWGGFLFPRHRLRWVPLPTSSVGVGSACVTGCVLNVVSWVLPRGWALGKRWLQKSWEGGAGEGLGALQGVLSQIPTPAIRWHLPNLPVVPDAMDNVRQGSGCPKPLSTTSRPTQSGLTGTGMAPFSLKCICLLPENVIPSMNTCNGKCLTFPVVWLPWEAAGEEELLAHPIQPSTASAGYWEGRAPGCHECPGPFTGQQWVDRVLKLLQLSFWRISKLDTLGHSSFFLACLWSLPIWKPPVVSSMRTQPEPVLFPSGLKVFDGCVTGGSGKGKGAADPGDSLVVLKITHPYDSPGPSSSRAGEEELQGKEALCPPWAIFAI